MAIITPHWTFATRSRKSSVSCDSDESAGRIRNFHPVQPPCRERRELITEPGYHPAARLLYDPPKGFVLPPVPAQPTQSDIAIARSLLLDDLLGDFPFIGEAERAHALALLLVGFVRAMIEHVLPLAREQADRR